MGESKYFLNENNFNHIEEGMIYKNKGELFYFLFDVKANGGNRKYLEKQAQRYLEYKPIEEGKQKIVITKKFGNPKDNDDRRGGSVGKYAPVIKPLLLNAAPFKESNKGILEKIYRIVSADFYKAHATKKKNELYYELDFLNILCATTKTALESLKAEGKIDFTYLRYKTTERIEEREYIKRVRMLEVELGVEPTQVEFLHEKFSTNELLQNNLTEQSCEVLSKEELQYIKEKRKAFCEERNIEHNNIYFSRYREEYIKYVNLQLGYIGIFNSWKMYDVKKMKHSEGDYLSGEEMRELKVNLREKMDYKMYCEIRNQKTKCMNSFIEKEHREKASPFFVGGRRARVKSEKIEEIEERDWYKDKTVKAAHCRIFKYSTFEEVDEKYQEQYEQFDKMIERTRAK